MEVWAACYLISPDLYILFNNHRRQYSLSRNSYVSLINVRCLQASIKSDLVAPGRIQHKLRPSNESSA